MRFLTIDEAGHWIDALGIDLQHKSLEQTLGNPLVCKLPADTGKKVALSKNLIAQLKPQPESLFWITGWSNWPSSENINLFYGYRKSLGEPRTLKEIPAQVFSEADLAEIECLLDLALFFSWDGWIVEASKGLIVKISHDELLTIYAVDPNRLRFLRVLCSQLGDGTA